MAHNIQQKEVPPAIEANPEGPPPKRYQSCDRPKVDLGKAPYNINDPQGDFIAAFHGELNPNFGDRVAGLNDPPPAAQAIKLNTTIINSGLR
ncbi:MAG: hypothetical protein EBY39_04210 [Flavobacteriia bacterium]|nr:hypothetical protein [Flavobacteriia bacterium]